MGLETMDKTHLFGEKKSVNFRLHNVSGYLPSLTELFPNCFSLILTLLFTHLFIVDASYKTELLEIQAADPKLHVLFIPGNPGF